VKSRTQRQALQHFLILICVTVISSTSCDKQDEGVDFMPTYPTIDCNPEWSSDGATIVFSHLHCDSAWKEIPDSSGLWFMSPDGTNKRLFTNQLRGQTRWSPDGQWLLFDKAYRIWKVNVTGESLALVLSDSGGKNYLPTWSPDGNRIAFCRYQEDGRTGIYTMAADGSDLRYIGYGGAPDWSPDGKRIAYTVLDYLGVKDTNGEHDTKLVTTDAGTGVPAFSPDGSKIAFAATINKRGGIYLIEANGNSLRFLVANAACPSWSPDGRKIVFVGFIYEEPRPDGFLYVINADGSGRRRLTFGPDQ